MTRNDYKGFCLFNDIQDLVLRTRNRAIVLANLATDHTRNRLISPAGAGMILGYFNQIPEEERAQVRDAFQTNMKERGFVLAS